MELDGAFANCTSLTRVTIPASVKKINMLAFSGCTNLTSVTFQGKPDIHNLTFDGNLAPRVFDGPGTYARFAGGEIWKANFTPAETAARQRETEARQAEQKAREDEAVRREAPRKRAALSQDERWNADLHYNKGVEYFNNSSDYDSAIAEYTESIRLNPYEVDVYVNRGYAYLYKGNLTQARTDVNKALQLNPDSRSAKDLDAELKNNGNIPAKKMPHILRLLQLQH